MLDDPRSRGRRSRWISYLAVVTAVALGAMAAVAVAQQGQPTQTETTQTETTQTDPAQEVTTEEESTAGVEAETRAEVETTATTYEVGVRTDVVPVGGTGAGAGGLAGDDGSSVPILIGVAGLLMAATAAVLMRRRRLE